MSVSSDECSKKQEDEFRKKEDLEHHLMVISFTAKILASMHERHGGQMLHNGLFIIMESCDRARALCSAA